MLLLLVGLEGEIVGTAAVESVLLPLSGFIHPVGDVSRRPQTLASILKPEFLVLLLAV